MGELKNLMEEVFTIANELIIMNKNTAANHSSNNGNQGSKIMDNEFENKIPELRERIFQLLPNCVPRDNYDIHPNLKQQNAQISYQRHDEIPDSNGIDDDPQDEAELIGDEDNDSKNDQIALRNVQFLENQISILERDKEYLRLELNSMMIELEESKRELKETVQALDELDQYVHEKVETVKKELELGRIYSKQYGILQERIGEVVEDIKASRMYRESKKKSRDSNGFDSEKIDLTQLQQSQSQQQPPSQNQLPLQSQLQVPAVNIPENANHQDNDLNDNDHLQDIAGDDDLDVEDLDEIGEDENDPGTEDSNNERREDDQSIEYPLSNNELIDDVQELINEGMKE